MLDGEVENQWSDCGVKYSTGQELVSQVNGKEIRLAGSVESVDGEVVLLFLSITISLMFKTQQGENMHHSFGWTGQWVVCAFKITSQDHLTSQ